MRTDFPAIAAWRAATGLGVALALVSAAVAALAPPAAAPAPARPDFDRDVAPILQEHCLNCHSATVAEGDLVMESYEDVMKGGAHGTPVAPGRSDQSRLVLMVEGKVKPKMPPKRPLPPEALSVIEAWINAGAEPPASTGAAQIPRIKSRLPRPSPVYSLAFSPDGKWLAVSGYKEISVLDPAGGRRLRRLTGPTDLVRSVAFSPDGRWLAAAGGTPARGGEIVLWDAATGRPARTIKGHRDYVYQAIFSPDGNWLATSSYDKTIRLWDVSTGIERATLREHTDAVFPVAFSPDGRWLASGAGDRTVKIWDVSSGKRLFTLSDSLDTVYALAFHPSDRQLSAAGADKMIRTWDLTGQDGTLALATIAHEDAILQLAYTADGRRMVTTAADRTVKVWDVETKAELRVLPPQGDWPTSLALAPDGRRGAVGRYDGSVSMYDLASGRLRAELLRPPPPRGDARSSGGYATQRGER
jgi:WD40 repeat protein